MHLEILVEEPSAESALGNLIPKILGDEVSFLIHPHQGKDDLLSKLPSRLCAYAKWMPPEYCVVVLLDLDSQDCVRRKDELERFAETCGLLSKTAAAQGRTKKGVERFQILNRIAIEELEAWFFGDVPAIAAAYPGVPSTLASQARYRDPDSIAGGTWEALERVLQRAGHHGGGLAKIAAARAISAHMEPSRNRSRSFQVFCAGLRALLE